MQNIEYLLESGQPWVVYRTLKDLLGRGENDADVAKAKQEMLAHPLVAGLIREVNGWPGIVVNSHKSAGMLYHKLCFPGDLVITWQDADFAPLIMQLLAHRSEEGLFQMPLNVGAHFGGEQLDLWGWALCDAPLLLYFTSKMGFVDRSGIEKGLQYLLGIVRENGWPCTVSKELGKFRGPGKKSDPCPYADLAMLRLLSLFKDLKDGPQARAGVACLLNAWENSRESHPYMFFMGTDFRKLKAPFIWYDILHVADVLSRYEYAAKDWRLREMADIINSKADSRGLFTPESVWQAWKEWDFGQKKEPSAWLTFLVYRLNRNLEGG